MRIRKTFKATVWASAAICVAAVLFLGVSWIAEYRPDARETVIYDTAEPVFLPDTLTVLSWNIGYAGLGDDMDFFYDGGKRVRDSRRRTLENLRNIVAELRKADADIMLLQEVDCDSHRSYGIREVDSLRAAFPGYVLSFAYNYRAWWVPIPLRSPMGRVGSGLVTLSRVVPLQAQRVQYPSAFPFPVRLFNLKRCLLALQIYAFSGGTFQRIFRASGGRFAGFRAGIPVRVRRFRAFAALPGRSVDAGSGRRGTSAAAADDADRFLSGLSGRPCPVGAYAAARFPVERSQSGRDEGCVRKYRRRGLAIICVK